MSPTDPVKTLMVIRRMVPQDVAYIRSSWLASYYEHGVRRPTFPGREYRERWGRIIAALLSSAKVWVAVAQDDNSVILGWACVESETRIHYIHVVHSFQRWGVATALLSQAGVNPAARVLYSHRTTDSDRGVPSHWEYCPWLLLGIESK